MKSSKPLKRWEKEDLLLNNTINYLALKTFNFDIIYAFFIDIIVGEGNLIKNIVRDWKIIEVDHIVKKVIYVYYYRRFSISISTQEVEIVANSFNSIKVLP